MRSCPSNLTLNSPAKINLFLRVLGRREDGFHEIASLFQAVKFNASPSLDKLTFTLSDQDSLTTNDPLLSTDEHNLVTRAIHLFRKKSALSFHVKAHLEKHIPIGAGLGGGSGNAATTLFAINHLLGSPFSENELQTMSSEIGSDIPFFFSSGTAFCQGRGERVKSLPSLSLLKLWLVTPPFSLKTAEVFSMNNPPKASKVSPEALLEGFLKGEGRMINDLEPRAFILKPELQAIKEELLSQHFSEVALTGSGSSLICIGDQKPALAPHYLVVPLTALSRKEGEWY